MSGSFLNGFSTRVVRRHRPRPVNLASLLTRVISCLLMFFALLLLLLSALAEPAPGAPDVAVPQSSPTPAFVTVNHLGESDQQATLRGAKLLSHHRATDPFGITIRGPFKSLPPVVERPTATPAQPNAVNQVAAAITVPTLEKAVQELAVGGVNLDSRQILIGSRSIREGDLLVLEYGGSQFVVWVQSVGVSGVLFCDTDLQKHILKPLGSGPKALPGNSVRVISDISNFLEKDAKQ
jgi:hypothetical protein